MVEVAIMEVINMSRMFDGSMAAASAMFMTVVGMGIWGAHKIWGLVNTKGFCQMRVRNRSM
jgi:hypothetical protein